jgi:hypothetical protein
MGRHSQPQDLAPAVPKNQQTIKQPKGKRWNDKEIDCGNPFRRGCAEKFSILDGVDGLTSTAS